MPTVSPTHPQIPGNPRFYWTGTCSDDLGQEPEGLAVFRARPASEQGAARTPMLPPRAVLFRQPKPPARLDANTRAEATSPISSRLLRLNEGLAAIRQDYDSQVAVIVKFPASPLAIPVQAACPKMASVLATPVCSEMVYPARPRQCQAFAINVAVIAARGQTCQNPHAAAFRSRAGRGLGTPW
jgi:hypothetical protein